MAVIMKLPDEDVKWAFSRIRSLLSRFLLMEEILLHQTPLYVEKNTYIKFCVVVGSLRL